MYWYKIFLKLKNVGILNFKSLKYRFLIVFLWFIKGKNKMVYFYNFYWLGDYVRLKNIIFI